MKRAKKKSTQRRLQSNGHIAPQSGHIATQEDDDMYQEPHRVIKIPVNQLKLSELDLKEEHTRVLTANDPNVANNITKFNYHSHCYKIDPPGGQDNLAIHLNF